jgi:omega-6 fatty acid desaturase (delta-12 desaturase)
MRDEMVEENHNLVGNTVTTWRKIVKNYQHPELGRSLFQVANTLIPYIILWALMVWSLGISYWLTLLLAIPAGGFMVRTFIIFHDCCHGSFFQSQRANDILGIVTGIITFTPYYHWRRNHAVHHATAGDLDRRGTGDVLTITVDEYLALSWWKKTGYRIMRWPLFMFTIGPLFIFLIGHRVWGRGTGSRERASVIWTNLALVAIIALASLTIGLKSYVLVQLPILLIGGSVGVWLFYIQHNFEGVYWERHSNWSFLDAALRGSSYYKLPKLFQWFTGNIGFHHIHHLSPRIPNYKLEKCHRENPLFQKVNPITIWASLRSLNYRLWDEKNRRLVSFGEIKKLEARLARGE